MKLNLGCGSTKIKGYINIDVEKSCKPDLVFDFTRKNLPYKIESVDEILFFHCIEHIRKKYHRKILLDCARVLKLGGKIYISYPNFWECAQRWHENTGGLKDFWEATLYGRQLYESDFHVCAMNPDELTNLLYECGFRDIVSKPESEEIYNTITTGVKSKPPSPSYETTVAEDFKRMKVCKLNMPLFLQSLNKAIPQL